VGWRLRESRSGYALILQGGGVGSFISRICSVAALSTGAGGISRLRCWSGSQHALQCSPYCQDSLALAITGAAGGFVAPIPDFHRGGNHVALFSFYRVLDAGILAIAYYKAWREAQSGRFRITFVIGLVWGMKYYRPELFATTEPFLILFFLVLTSRSRCCLQCGSHRGLRTTLMVRLIFGTPLIAFGLQTALVRDMEVRRCVERICTGRILSAAATLLHARSNKH